MDEMTTVSDPTGSLAIETEQGARLQKSASDRWKHMAALVWLTFSVALAVWWIIFGLGQIQRFSSLTQRGSQITDSQLSEIASELARQHRMLMSEGITLVVLLLLGGGTLLYYINTEIRRGHKVREFFAAFTHDLKTSLASLRLQAESLEEDLKDSGEARIARRLVKDTVRLELQLENSLMLAAPESESKLLLEPLDVGSALESTAFYWPDLELQVHGKGLVEADSRALESILKNLMQNSVIHGRASKVTVDIKREGNWVHVLFADDGRGFKGEQTRLGKMFERHSSSSGTGLGLYLAMNLAKRMSGELRFAERTSGFAVELLLPSADSREEN
jgi:signal transduction histidine kinase